MTDDTQLTPQDDTADEPTPYAPATAAPTPTPPAQTEADPDAEEDATPAAGETPPTPPLETPPAQETQEVATDDAPGDTTDTTDDEQADAATPAAPATGAAAGSPTLSLQSGVASTRLPDDLRELDAYWDSVLTGNPATVPAEIRSLAGADDDALDTEEQNYRLTGAINRSWAVDHLGMSKEAVADGWKECRTKLARELGVADDENEVFIALSARAQDKPRREAGKRIFETAYLAGLKGAGQYDIRDIRKGLDAEDGDAADALGQEAYGSGLEMRRKWLPLAERVARGCDAFSGAEEEVFSAPRVLAAAPDLLQAVDELADLGEQDRETVFFLAAQIAGQSRQTDGEEEEGLGSRMVRAVRRGAGNIGMGVAQVLNHAGMVTLSNLGGLWGGESGKAMEQAADAWDRRSTVFARLRNLSQREIAPLYPPDAARRAESYLIDAAEATPAAVLAFCGGSGFAALAASGMGGSVEAARSLNPQGDHELQLAAGILGGAVQGAIYMGMGRLGGRMLEQSIANFMKSRGAGVGAFSMNTLKSAAAASLHGTELIAAGKIASAAEMGSQEVAARLSGTASHIDWRSFGDNLTDIETNMREAAAILPFLLIGSGRVALRHFRSPHAVLGEGLALRDWGVDDATRLQIMKEPDIDMQSTRLRDALRGSRRWSAPGFIPDIVRAMNLFNGDYFNGFRDVDCVRDFLRIPSERSLLENKVIVERDATAPEVLNLVGHAESRDLRESLKGKPKFAEVMRFWDDLYQRAHLDAHTPRRYFGLLPEEVETVEEDRVLFYSDITEGRVPTIPHRMRNIGYFNPQGEAERRALLRDRSQECIDLSYQFVLSTYTVDSLMSHSFPMSRIATHLERTRNNILGQIARSVLDMAMGMSAEESASKLTDYLADHCVRRSYRGAAPEWMKKTDFRHFWNMGDYVPKFFSPEIAHHRDFRNVLRVVGGMNACARTLVRLLPMTSDFHAAMARGMSPLQAYDHLLVRELGYDPEKVAGYPATEIKESANLGDMQLFSEKNRKCFDQARLLAGTEVEKCEGDDGLTYHRIRRPDGGFTRWHTEEKDAVNELAMSVAPYFGPLGRGIHSWIFRAYTKGGVNMNEIPHASFRRFSGFDQLCSIATQELGDFWHRSVSRTQPGFLPTDPRGMLTGKNIPSALFARTDEGKLSEPGVDVSLNQLSILTPASVINSRFHVFWERAFKSGMLSVPEAGEFLMQRGYLTPERYQKICDLSKVLPYPKNRNVPLRLTPPPDIAGTNREMAREMARFQSLYFFAHLQDANVPESVKSWFRMVPFCPDLPEMASASNFRVKAGKQKVMAAAWSNRQIAMQLKNLAPEVEAMRRQVAESPLPPGRIPDLFRQAVGESEPQRYEQSWCYHYCGPGVFRGTPQQDWNLMLDPMRSWKLFSDEEKQDMRARLESFCREDPSTEALDAAGRGEQVDDVECSLRQLDRVLQRFPDLHRYAPTADNSLGIRLVRLNDEPQRRDLNEEPDYAPVPVRWDGDFHAAFSVASLSEVPEALRTDPEAMSSLRFLDAMRRVAIGRPYAMGNGICWNGKVYGGQFGIRPKGLESWQEDEPLEPLFRLLGNVDKICRETGASSLPVCGVKLQGGDWTKRDFDELSQVSVYRWPTNRSRTYRLMPGYPDSPNIRVRTPYVVACHCGTYLKGEFVIREAEDLPSSFCPLEYFKPSHIRYHNEHHLRQWRNLSLDSILDSIVDRPTYLAACGNAESGVVGMGELLLRLCEDTGFCRAINPEEPHELNAAQASVVNIAGAMLECMRSRGDVRSMERLQAAVAPVQNNPLLRHHVFNALRESTDKLAKETSVHNDMQQQLLARWEAMEKKRQARRHPNSASDKQAPQNSKPKTNREN